MLLIKLITLVFGFILTGHLHRPENSSELIRSPLGNILEAIFAINCWIHLAKFPIMCISILTMRKNGTLDNWHIHTHAKLLFTDTEYSVQ